MTEDEDRAVDAARDIEAQLREILEKVKERGRLIESIAHSLGIDTSDLDDCPAARKPPTD